MKFYLFRIIHYNYDICKYCFLGLTAHYDLYVKKGSVIVYLIQNSQAVKKVCGPQKGCGEKRCEIQGGGQEMAVMVG